MTDLSQEAKQKIDSMPREKLIEEIDKGIRSRFQNEKFAYLKTRLSIIDAEDEAKHRERSTKLAEEANRIAKDANVIATNAKAVAEKSFYIAILSVIVALVAIGAGYFNG